MDNKQKNELDFWKWLLSTKDNYKDFRYTDGVDKMKYFTDLRNRDGVGLDLGCGLVSVFEGLDNTIVALDPLNDEYLKLFNQNQQNIKYITASGEDIPFKDGYFDYIFCVNVIDHTPNPKKMASEIKRVLAKGGKLYFEVNFDDELSPCHYDLWDESTVNEMFGDLKCTFELKERNEKDKQHLYYAIYE